MARVKKLSLTFGCRKNDSAVDRSSIDVTILPESEKDNTGRTDKLEGVYRRLCQDQSGPFLLLNLGKLLESYRSWEDNLKIVRPFYGEFESLGTSNLSNVVIHIADAQMISCRMN